MHPYSFWQRSLMQVVDFESVSLHVTCNIIFVHMHMTTYTFYIAVI